MTKDLSKNSYRTYCRDRLVVSESANKVYVENAIEDLEKTKIKRTKKTATLIIK